VKVRYQKTHRPKFATRVRTCLTVTVYELPTIFDPLVHNVLHRVESRGPPLVRRLLPRIVEDGLGIVGCDGEGRYSQGPKPDKLPERCLHAGRSRRETWAMIGNRSRLSAALPPSRCAAPKRISATAISPGVVDQIIDHVCDPSSPVRLPPEIRSLHRLHFNDSHRRDVTGNAFVRPLRLYQSPNAQRSSTSSLRLSLVPQRVNLIPSSITANLEEIRMKR